MNLSVRGSNTQPENTVIARPDSGRLNDSRPHGGAGPRDLVKPLRSPSATFLTPAARNGLSAALHSPAITSGATPVRMRLAPSPTRRPGDL